MSDREKLRYLVSLICIVAALFVIAVYFGLYADSIAQGIQDFLQAILPDVFVALIATPVVFFLLERKGIIQPLKEIEELYPSALAESITNELEDRISNHKRRIGGVICFEPNWREFDWSEQLRDVKELEIVVSYWGGWIKEHLDELTAIFNRGGRISIILPSPENSEAVEATRLMFPEHSSASLRKKIQLTVACLLVAYYKSSSPKKKLEVRYFLGRLNYAAVRFDRQRLYYGFYEHFREFRISSPSILVDLQSSSVLDEFWNKEFDGFMEKTGVVPLEELRPLQVLGEVDSHAE